MSTSCWYPHLMELVEEEGMQVFAREESTGKNSKNGSGSQNIYPTNRPTHEPLIQQIYIPPPTQRSSFPFSSINGFGRERYTF